ncbi:MAG: hypothetical protein V5A34_10270 [Halapricum sp.]
MSSKDSKEHDDRHVVAGLASITILSIFISLYSGYYVNWIVIISGILAGIVLVSIVNFIDENCIFIIPLILLYLIIINISFQEEGLRLGVVAMHAAAAVFKSYKIYR